MICKRGHTRLILVFPLDLQDVEEIGSGGVYLDEILIRLRLRFGKLCYFKLFRPLKLVLISNG